MDVKVTKEIFQRALECKSAGELMEFCKEQNIDITPEDAEKFLSQVSEQELDLDTVEQTAGGICFLAVKATFCIGIGT